MSFSRLSTFAEDVPVLVAFYDSQLMPTLEHRTPPDGTLTVVAQSILISDYRDIAADVAVANSTSSLSDILLRVSNTDCC